MNKQKEPEYNRNQTNEAQSRCVMGGAKIKREEDLINQTETGRAERKSNT